MTLAFVTALYAIREGYTDALHQQFQHLLSLLPAGTPIFVWTDLEVSYVAAFPNIRLHVLRAPLTAFETWCTHVEAGTPLGLPVHRNAAKDTLEFLALMNTKVEMQWRALPYIAGACPEVTHMAWIDCGIHKIFKATDDVRGALATVCRGPWPAEQVLMPGCWEHVSTAGHLRVDAVDWRFCGGFYVVPLGSLDRFYRGAQQILCESCWGQGATTWEVNVWAALEARDPSLFRWFKADHNITMLRLPLN